MEKNSLKKELYKKVENVSELLSKFEQSEYFDIYYGLYNFFVQGVSDEEKKKLFSYFLNDFTKAELVFILFYSVLRNKDLSLMILDLKKQLDEKKEKENKDSIC